MLPLLNGKSFLQCSEADLSVLIDNNDFRENEYIDYKQTFDFLDIPKEKKAIRDEKTGEFRSDVCALANAEGGYLIYGIRDKNGCADEIIGIDIPDGNTDQFELDRRNNLAPISPRIPYLKFHFVPLSSGKYVLILFVKHDSFAPYIHLEGEKNYLIYKRIGNGKRVIGYQELKNMFNQSLSLDKEIYNYRMDRINYYRSQEDDEQHSYSQFLMLHIIPETFIDPTYNQNMLILEKSKGVPFSNIFSEFSCSSQSIPCVDGLLFAPYSKQYPSSECFVYNNAVVECFFPLRESLNIGYEKCTEGYIAWYYIWDKIYGTIYKYDEVFKQLYSDKIYICVSIIGCKGIRSTGENEKFYRDYIGKIDRNIILCSPISLDNMSSKEEEETLLKKLYIEYMISIGIKREKYLDECIREVYHV